MTDKHQNNNNNNNTPGESDISAHYYAANDALDVMIRSQQHVNTQTRHGHGHGNIHSLLSTSMDTTQYHDGDSQQQETRPNWKTIVMELYKKDSLLIDVLVVILIAKIYPPLGAEYLFPEITAHWVAVIVIFCKYFYVFFRFLGMCCMDGWMDCE